MLLFLRKTSRTGRGLYIDRKEVLHAHINAMSKDDLINRLKELDKESGGALKQVVEGEYTDVSQT